MSRRWVRASPTAAPASSDSPRVAVIGTGPAALACARALAAGGARVSWCTSRGKLASQMGPKNQTLCRPGQPFHDYGCQYFTVSDPVFQAEVERWAKLGACQKLEGIGTLDSNGFKPFSKPCWVGNGGMYPMMTMLMKQAAEEFGDALRHVSGFPTEDHKVQSFRKTADGWTLTQRNGEEFGPFDVVVGAFSQHCLTDPFLASGGSASAKMLACLRQVESNQIIAMQVFFARPLPAKFAAAHVVDDPYLCFVSNNSRKPQQDGSMGTSGAEAWTLLSTAGFAEREFNTNPKGYRRSAEHQLLASLGRLLGTELAQYSPQVQRINHWEDGLPMTSPTSPCLFDSEQGLGWCGDFCVAPCVQGAFQSGLAMAEELKTFFASAKTSSLPSSQWPAMEAPEDAALVDIGAFPGLREQLPSSCSHTDLVPSAKDGYQAKAHFGAAGMAKGDKGKGKGKGKVKGKGKKK